MPNENNIAQEKDLQIASLFLMFDFCAKIAINVFYMLKSCG